MISNPKKVWLALCAAACVVSLAGCNEQLRQFIVPVPKPTGDPGATAHAVVLSTNPAAAGNGSTFHVDVSGDTAVGVVPTGPNPLFLGKGPAQVFVINGNSTITSYLGLAPLSPPINTITMPGGSLGPVAGGTSSSGNFYTANSNSNNVDVLSAFVNAITLSVPSSGSAPVAIAGNSINNKIYVVNQGTNNVSVISTTDNTVIKTIMVGLQPIWAVMANNGIQVFVVNQGDGTVSVIDTNLDIVIPCAPGPQCNSGTGAISVGPSPNFAYYENTKQRLYVSNTGNNSVSVIKADGIDLGVTPQILPGFLKNIPLSGSPISVAALSNGTKAYAALANCTDPATNHTNLVSGSTPHLPNCKGNQVSVIDTVGLRELRTITVGPGVVSVDVAANASRAYVVSAFDSTTIKDNVHNPSCTASPCTTTGGGCIALPCLPGAPQPDRTFPTTPSISVIQTASDTVLQRITDPSIVGPVPTFLTPPQDPNCTPALDQNFNKTVPIPCAGQTAFQVRVFP
jgi:YVTN family beta-propeller protein